MSGDGHGWYFASGEHRYVSTACLHGYHDLCGKAQHDRGEDGLPHCKYCDAVCACPECKHGTEMSNDA